MNLDRHLRTPLTVGLLAVTATFGLAGCVPAVDDSGDDSKPAVEETTQAPEPTEESTPDEESTPEEEPTPEEETPSEEGTPDEESSPTEEPDDDATESSEKSTSASSAGTVDAAALSGEPLEVVTGKGGDTVEVPDHDDPLVVVFENTTDSEHGYMYGTAKPGQSLDGADAGESIMMLLDPYSPNGGLASSTKAWDIEGEGNETFSISFYPLDAVPTAKDGETIEAEGPGIFRWSLEDDAYMAVEHDGESNFIVKGEAPKDSGEYAQLAFNEIGALKGGLEVEDGEYLITVEADGNWSFAPITEEEYEAMPGEES